MAATTAGGRLTEAHRLAQARLGARTVNAMRAVWPLLDAQAIDATVERWLTAAVPVIRDHRATSSRLAANYTTTFKAIELGGVTSTPTVLAEAVPVEAVTTSLLVTGPYRLRKALARATPLVQALSTAEAESAAAAMRHALNGGRDTIIQTANADRQALGWARAASGRACAFCALLASRGPVYSKNTVDFRAHDHCSCSAAPVYREDDAWPAGSRHYDDLYRQAKAADGDTLTNFRRLVAA